MNAPLAADSFNVVAVIPTVKVGNANALEKGLPVSGTVVSCQRIYSEFFHEPVWRVEASLEGGLKAHFGCKEKDLDAIGGHKKIGQSFTAIVSTGPGPARDEMDLEPASVWYLKDLRLGAVRVVPKNETSSFVAEEMTPRVA